MFISGDEYLAMIDQLNTLLKNNDEYRRDNITLGQQIIRQRQCMKNTGKQNVVPFFSPTTPQLGSSNEKRAQEIVEKSEKSLETQTDKKDRNRNQVNKILQYLNETEERMCKKIQSAVEQNQDLLLEKMNELQKKESKKSIKSIQSGSTKNMELSNFFIQIKALYKVWGNCQKDPTNLELIEWINEKNSEARDHQQKLVELKKELSGMERKKHHPQEKEEKIKISVRPPLSNSKLQKQSIMNREKLTANNKKATEKGKSSQKIPTSSQKISKGTKIKDSKTSKGQKGQKGQKVQKAKREKSETNKKRRDSEMKKSVASHISGKKKRQSGVSEKKNTKVEKGGAKRESEKKSIKSTKKSVQNGGLKVTDMKGTNGTNKSKKSLLNVEKDKKVGKKSSKSLISKVSQKKSKNVSESILGGVI